MLSLKELKSLNRKELLKELKEARAQMQKIRLTIKTGHEKNTSLSKKWKRQTARILTCLNEIEFEGKGESHEESSEKAEVKKEAKISKSKKQEKQAA